MVLLISRTTHLLRKLTKLKILLGKFGWDYCQYCGEKLTFDEENLVWDIGHTQDAPSVII